MLKKMTLLLSVALPFSFPQAFATWEEFQVNDTEGGSTVKAIWKNPQKPGKFILTSADPASHVAYVQTLTSLPIKEGYPGAEGSEGRFKAQNIDRQKAKNLYHLYTLSYQGENEDQSSLGFVQFGRMPSKGYQEGTENGPTIHHPIIQKWINLGITEKIDPNGSLEDANIKRINNRGLAMILPLFKVDATEEQKKGAIEACYELTCQFKRNGSLLPVEGTLPYVVMSLFRSDDSNVALFSANSFEADTDSGFGWFYPKEGIPQPRTMITRLVEARE